MNEYGDHNLSNIEELCNGTFMISVWMFFIGIFAIPVALSVGSHSGVIFSIVWGSITFTFITIFAISAIIHERKSSIIKQQ